MPLFRFCLLGLILLPGCATLIDGTTQDVAVRTAPMGAACVLQRGTEDLGTIASTPGHMLVERGRHDLTVICRKPGWETAVTAISSSFTGVTLGNLIIGGIPGFIVDATTGSGFLYNETDKIILMTPQTSNRTPDVTSFAPMMPTKPVSGFPLLDTRKQVTSILEPERQLFELCNSKAIIGLNKHQLA